VELDVVLYGLSLSLEFAALLGAPAFALLSRRRGAPGGLPVVAR
jgi:hypothetical protein